MCTGGSLWPLSLIKYSNMANSFRALATKGTMISGNGGTLDRGGDCEGGFPRLLRRRQTQQLSNAIKAQAARRKFFGDSIANNPSWDVLLDLYEKSFSQRAVPVKSLCIASGVPATMALRRLNELVETGFVRRIGGSNRWTARAYRSHGRGN